MKISSAVIYTFRKPIQISAEEFNAKLKDRPFIDLLETERSKAGFVPPFPFKPGTEEGLEFLYPLSGRWYFSLRVDTRDIKASSVSRILNKRVSDIEEQQARKVYKKEREQLKDEVMIELLPSTIPTTKVVSGYINPSKGLLVVDQASFKAAEGVMSHLRSAIETLPVATVGVQRSPSACMTEWLLSDFMISPDDDSSLLKLALEGVNQEGNNVCPLSVGSKGVFKDSCAESAAIRLSGVSLSDEKAINYIQAGFRCTELELIPETAIDSLSLTDDLLIKSIKLSSEFNVGAEERADNMNVDFDASKQVNYIWDADAILMAELLEDIWEKLIKNFGGYDEPPAVW